VDHLWATKSEDVGLIDRAISFQDSQPMWSGSTYVTDRRTDRQTDDMCFQDCTLRYSASRGKNKTMTLTVTTDEPHKYTSDHRA